MKFTNINAHFGVWMWHFFLFWAEVFLAVRFVLHFFAIGPNGGFAAWIFHSTDALLAPFRGVFANSGAVAGHPHYVDLQLLFVMAAYAVFAVAMWSVIGWCKASVSKKAKK